MTTVLGVDVGGTFTDFFALGPGGMRVWKRLSTPRAPEEAVIAGAGDAAAYDRFVHGSTVATNALLERRGPRTVLITTEGFGDLLEIRRQVRPHLYDLEPARPPHVVARGDAIEVRERLDASGGVVISLTDDEVDRVVEAARASKGECFAICLLHSFRNPEHERRLAEALRVAGFEASASHEVFPEHREYERASTTAINVFLRPTVERYLSRLATSAPGLRVMHSAAGLADPATASARPVTMVMSGPAGGVLGALAIAKTAGYERIITFDMGGTSTDVSLCDGTPRFRGDTEVDGMALHTPMVDVVTVGAGGGSIARIDEGGALVVGPESAGADPGPACYGRGGQPTVTDADLVAGRLPADVALAGGLRLDEGRARAALERLGRPEEMAAAVVRVVNANMARAVRRVSLERGYDPADFTLVAFGGAGPLHACELADDVGIPRVMVPRYPGVLSALGMVTAPESIELGRGLLVPADAAAAEALRDAAAALRAETEDAFAATGAPIERVVWLADARYEGQAHELRVAVEDPAPDAIAGAFHEAHLQRYGYHAPARPVTVVALRCRVEGPRLELPMAQADARAEAQHLEPSAGGAVTVDRAGMAPGSTLRGPCIVAQEDATTFVPGGWRGEVDAQLNLVLERAT
ncbi:MAG: hydantoinase/oxoprolinase family protein [Dehalococcoidia bacterium]